MKYATLTAASLLLLCLVLPRAQAETGSEAPQLRKDCQELKTEIEARIRANGVPVFRLDILTPEAAESSEGRIVGSCDGGTRRIVYRRGVAPDSSD